MTKRTYSVPGDWLSGPSAVGYDTTTTPVNFDPLIGLDVQTQMMVEDPSVDDTVEILRGLRERYEFHHYARISDAQAKANVLLDEQDRLAGLRHASDRLEDVLERLGVEAK